MEHFRVLTPPRRSGSVKSDEIPDFILALLLVGLDSRSSSAVLTSVMSCIDAICASLADGSTVEPNLVSYTSAYIASPPYRSTGSCDLLKDSEIHIST